MWKMRERQLDDLVPHHLHRRCLRPLGHGVPDRNDLSGRHRHDHDDPHRESHLRDQSMRHAAAVVQLRRDPLPDGKSAHILLLRRRDSRSHFLYDTIAGHAPLSSA